MAWDESILQDVRTDRSLGQARVSGKSRRLGGDAGIFGGENYRERTMNKRVVRWSWRILAILALGVMAGCRIFTIER